MGVVPETAQLLSRLPTHLAIDLFASATRVKLAAESGPVPSRRSGRHLLSRREWSA